MKRNGELLEKRKEFIRSAFNDKDRAVNKLLIIAKKLDQAERTSEIVDILRESMFLSERTIFDEYKK